MADLQYPANASLYYHNELANVIGHADGYVRIEWNPVPIRSSSLRAVYEHVLGLLRSQGISKILTDNQFMPPVPPSEQEWLIQNWAPRAVLEAGYRFCAIIQAHDVLSQLATQHMVQQLACVPLTIRYFEDSREAESWLLHS